ncbi:MAG: YfhO family protein [Lachnospiraceae bacterium]|nr:YfhO family protein [Lachnospiraceae bacterium]
MNTHNYHNNREKLSSFFYPILLILFVLACVWLILPADSLFGSEGDWLSQHVGAAEQFRKIFQETGRIFPDSSPAGSGSNIYDFSYYGFLRPDVLISFLLPKIPMAFIISVYAVGSLAAGAVLFYYLLKKHLTFDFFAFLGGILYASASCFYHTHHQIMFVNYMPFLLLALFGVERLLHKGRHGLLVLSLALVYLHSYYFAPAVLAVVFLYFIHCLYFEKITFIPPLKCWLRFLFSIGISIGMTAILLLPTGLDLLSTKKDAGTPASLAEIFSLEFSMESLLYHPYGCGLTILCLYTLFLSIRRKSTRFLSLLLLLCLTANTCSYVLSGFLYVRYKVLIPLVPLLLILCVRTLEELFTGREKHSLICGALCLVPLLSSDYPQAILVDFTLAGTAFLFLFGIQHYFSRKKSAAPSPEIGQESDRKKTAYQTMIPCLLLCLFPAASSILIGQQDEFISKDDNRQSVFSQEELEALNLQDSYRFDYLTEPYANANLLALPGMGSTRMYSSVTDYNYSSFFYQTMRNPIRVRNRVALMTDANPFFSYLMGIRYIQTKDSRIPWGYQPIAQKGNILIAENKNVLPIAYASTKIMSQKEYETLEFPYSLEALTRCTIAADASDNSEALNDSEISNDFSPETSTIQNISADSLMENSWIQPISLEDLPDFSKLVSEYADGKISCQQNPQKGELQLAVKEETSLQIPLSEPIHHKMLICTFRVASLKEKEVTIEINGIRNRLSGKSAPYPNHNDQFTYLIASNEEITELKFHLSSGTYTLSDFQIWTMDTSHWGNEGADPDSFQAQESRHPLQGKAVLSEKGYFVTSFPLRKGYRAYVDGTQVSLCTVNDIFLGFPLEAGAHEILISYTPPGKTFSVFLSLLSLFLFLAGEIYEIQIQHRKKEIL